MNALLLALKVLHIDGRTRISTVLTAVGVAIATSLVLLLISLPFATQARAQRALWQQPNYSANANSAKLIMSASTDYFNGVKITRIDLAVKANPSTVELPRGLPELPEPGETLVSPDLGALIHNHPASQLGDRFTEKLSGVVGEEALRYPGQLVAVVGHSIADMPANAAPMEGFTHGKASVDGLLQLLSGVGVVVLVVPSLVLVASSARLTAARRERRLAAVRLAGATPGQVLGMVAAETVPGAVVGSVLGLLSFPVSRGLATLVPWDGGTWLSADFNLPAGVFTAVALVIPALVVTAAVLGMRRVLRNPLIATGGHTNKPLHWSRLLALPISGLFFFYAISSSSDSGPLLVLLGLSLVVGSAAIIGPWITSAIGGTFVRRWRRAPGLLAGRRLREDPRGAYRASGGVVLAVFIGSLALTLLPSLESMAGGGRSFKDSVLYVETAYAQAAGIADKANAELQRYGQSVRAKNIAQLYLVGPNGSSQQALALDCADASELTRFSFAGGCAAEPSVHGNYAIDLTKVKVSGQPDDPGVSLLIEPAMKILPVSDPGLTSSLVIDPSVVPAGVTDGRATVAVPTTEENREVLRTALVNASAGEQVYSRELKLDNQQTQLADLRRVTLIGLIAAALLAGCSAAVATAGSVMDRRRSFGALMAAGTPVGVLSRALRMEAALPAMVATVAAGATGVFVGLGLFSLVGDRPLVLSPWLLAPVVLGIGVAVLAASVCTPALKRIQTEPLIEE